MTETMERRRLGRSGIEISALGFGGFAIGGNASGNSYGPTDDEQSVASVAAAVEAGCTFFDTADVYGFGKGERVLARGLGEHVDDVVVATKVGGRFDGDGVRPDHSPSHIFASIDRSLSRLGREHVDVYFLHDPPLDVIRYGAAFRAMSDLVRDGKIRVVGASVHSVEEADACLDDERVGVLQIPYNLFTLLHSVSSWDPVFRRARDQGVGIVAREPLANGFLSGRHDASTRYGAGDNRARIPRDRHALLCSMARSLADVTVDGVTQAQVALRFVLDEPHVSSVIVGMKSPAQVTENFGALALPSFSEIEHAVMEPSMAIEGE